MHSVGIDAVAVFDTLGVIATADTLKIGKQAVEWAVGDDEWADGSAPKRPANFKLETLVTTLLGKSFVAHRVAEDAAVTGDVAMHPAFLHKLFPPMGGLR